MDTTKKLKYTIGCRNCSGNFVLSVTSKDMFAWVKLEKDIDEAFSSLTTQEKTMLSSQLCAKCIEKFS